MRDFRSVYVYLVKLQYSYEAEKKINLHPDYAS